MGKILSYIAKRIDDFLDSVTDILTDHRSILCWIYATAYLVLVYYCIRTNPNTMNTAIAITGGVVSTIFASYVAGSAYEKAKNQPPTDESGGEENEAGD